MTKSGARKGSAKKKKSNQSCKATSSEPTIVLNSSKTTQLGEKLKKSKLLLEKTEVSPPVKPLLEDLKRKSQLEATETPPKRIRKVSTFDEDLLTENQRRLDDQKSRSIFVSLAGNLQSVSDSNLKALHPDILNVTRISHAGFLIFSSKMVRDRAFPIIEKQQLKKCSIKIGYCCGKASDQPKKTKKPLTIDDLALNQLVVSDLTKDTSLNMLEVIFPKACDIKLVRQKQFAYITFANESNALEAFKKSKSLKIAGVPVVVRYRVDGVKKGGAPADGPRRSVSKENDKPDPDDSKASPLKELESSDGEDEVSYEEIYEDIEVEEPYFEDEDGAGDNE